MTSWRRTPAGWRCPLARSLWELPGAGRESARGKAETPSWETGFASAEAEPGLQTLSSEIGVTAEGGLRSTVSTGTWRQGKDDDASPEGGRLIAQCVSA